MTDPAIEVLHVGSASRDLTDDDPRGWRLGGGVTYAALTTARLGLRTAAVVGADPAAAASAELDRLRDAGVSVLIAALDEGPVFLNEESDDGRVQTCLAPGRPIALREPGLPAAWRAATAWSLVPVAGEIADDWTAAVPEDAFVVLGWQGWLRELAAGAQVKRRPPEPSALLRRADLVGVSRHDLAAGTDVAGLRSMLRRDATLLVTDGERGGELRRLSRDGAPETWHYDAIAPDAEVDPTGAGDTFLAALLASVVRPGIAPDDRPTIGFNLAFAAAAASLVIERPGPLGVPDLDSVTRRLRRGRSAWRVAGD